MQNAFLVEDMAAAIEHWARVIQVGPFFLFERVEFKEAWYRNKPATDIDLTVAIAYWGDVQIELIRQRNDVASIYTDFQAHGRTGLQHMGVMTEDLDADLARLKARNVLPVQHGSTPGMRFAYVSTDHHPGGWLNSSRPRPERAHSSSACARRHGLGRQGVLLPLLSTRCTSARVFRHAPRDNRPGKCVTTLPTSRLASHRHLRHGQSHEFPGYRYLAIVRRRYAHRSPRQAERTVASTPSPSGRGTYDLEGRWRRGPWAGHGRFHERALPLCHAVTPLSSGAADGTKWRAIHRVK